MGCRICSSDRRAEIDAALWAGWPTGTMRAVSERFGIPKSSVDRHKRRHLAPRPVEATGGLQDDKSIGKEAEKPATAHQEALGPVVAAPVRKTVHQIALEQMYRQEDEQDRYDDY